MRRADQAPGVEERAWSPSRTAMRADTPSFNPPRKTCQSGLNPRERTPAMPVRTIRGVDIVYEVPGGSDPVSPGNHPEGERTTK